MKLLTEDQTRFLEIFKREYLKIFGNTNNKVCYGKPFYSLCEAMDLDPDMVKSYLEGQSENK